MSKESESPLYRKSDGVAYITFNRPSVMNAMDPPAYVRMLDLLRDIRDDDDIRLAILTGAEGNFTTGGDLTGYAKRDIEEWREGRNTLFIRELNDTLWNLKKPIISAIDGYCVGWGMVILAASDIRIATPRAKIGYGGALRVFGGGAAQGPERLVLQVPFVHAMKMLLTNPILSADEALQWNLLTEVVAAEADLLPRCEELATAIKQMPPLAVPIVKGAVRRVFNYATDQAHEVTLREGLAYKQTEDFEESLRAWAEKRDPVWKNR